MKIKFLITQPKHLIEMVLFTYKINNYSFSLLALRYGSYKSLVSHIYFKKVKKIFKKSCVKYVAYLPACAIC